MVYSKRVTNQKFRLSSCLILLVERTNHLTTEEFVVIIPSEQKKVSIKDIKEDGGLILELIPGVEIKSLSLHRTNTGKHLNVNLTDGRTVNLGKWHKSFTQEHFRFMVEEQLGITMTKRPVVQWDMFTVNLMHLATYGGGK